MTLDVARYESDTGWIEFTARDPAPHLRPRVERYWGFEERSSTPVRRVEVPYPSVIVVLSFGPQIRLGRVGESTSKLRVQTSFVAGLHDVAARTEHDGNAFGVELALTPVGARMLFGVAMHELASSTAAAEDVLGPRTPLLIERLYETKSWPARFELLDRELAARLADAPAPPRELEWGWRRLVATAGRTPIGRIADYAGWSRRRLVAEFRDHVGLPPKTFARVLRFQRAVQLVRAGAVRWTDVAYACGYADQAHFNRDFRAFAGMTPSEFAARLSGSDPGVRAD